MRALLPEHPELEVYTEVQRVLDVPHGSTLVLVPGAGDADWLNINRPVFSQRELQVVLFCDTATTVALARRAVDFFDWISHRVECPNQPPRFAVDGLRCALAARAPGIVWQGGDLEATFAAARPHGKLHKVSASLPYGQMLAELRAHRRSWIAWSDVNSHFRLRRVRWALAETGHRTRAILVEPTVSSPGWWPVHARLAELRRARAELEKAGALFPGRLAAINELEPEAITLMRLYLENGISAAVLDATLIGGAHSSEMKSKRDLEELSQELAPHILRGRAAPPLARGIAPRRLQKLCQAELTAIQQQMEKGEPLEREELASWVAWATAPSATLLSLDPELAVEMWLRSHISTQVRWEVLTFWAIMMSDLDAAESWARCAVSEKRPDARLTLASVRLAQGRYDEAASLIQDALADGELTPGPEHPLFLSASIVLAGVLMHQGRHQEAEALLRLALSSLEHDPAAGDLLRGALIYQLAKALSAQGRHDETESLLREALSLSTSESAQGIHLLHKASQLNELARVLVGKGRYDEAEPLLRQSLALMRQSLGDEHPLHGAALHELATLLLLLGRGAEAEPLFRQALSIKEDTQGSEDPSYAASLTGLASTLRAQGKYEEAEAQQRRALAIDERAPDTRALAHAATLHGLATILQEQARYAEAEALFRQSLSIKEQVLGPSHPDLGPTLANLGTTLAQQDRPAEGEPFIVRALEVLQAAHGSNHPNTGRALNLLAQCQHALGKEEAPETARKALETLAQTLGPDHPYTQGVKPMLQSIVDKARRTPEHR